jgi:SPP1 gp7 family putative phage head morphogenesis protein
MATANEDFLDALIRHQIGLMRLSGSIRNEITEILDRTERDLKDQIARRMRRGLPSDNIAANRIKALEKIVRNIRGQAMDEITAVWVREMKELAKAEPAFIDMALRTVSPVTLSTVIPSTADLVALLTAKPFEGRVLRDWAKDIRQADLDRIMAQVRIGIVQGENSAAIARRVVGTAALRGANGVTQITRNNAAALTRTMVNHFANQAKRAFYELNKDILDEELYVATLDSRTTAICRSLDGRRFAVGIGPIPPLHFACRSVRVGILDGRVLGRRPTKSSTDRQLLREYTRSQGLPKVSSRGALPRGHRGAFDAFSRRRVRELTGTVPADVNYDDFLKRQSREFQDEVLGVTKARLWRRGGLTLDKFVNRQGDELTLAELARSDAGAFRAAGLDPDNFI